MSAATVSAKAIDGVWATTLCVSGEQGLAALPKSVEAVIFVDEDMGGRAVSTQGFDAMLSAPMVKHVLMPAPGSMSATTRAATEAAP